MSHQRWHQQHPALQVTVCLTAPVGDPAVPRQHTEMNPGSRDAWTWAHDNQDAAGPDFVKLQVC